MKYTYKRKNTRRSMKKRYRGGEASDIVEHLQAPTDLPPDSHIPSPSGWSSWIPGNSATTSSWFKNPFASEKNVSFDSNIPTKATMGTGGKRKQRKNTFRRK